MWKLLISGLLTWDRAVSDEKISVTRDLVAERRRVGFGVGHGSQLHAAV